MIASVVVTLEECTGPLRDIVDEISELPDVEIGEFDTRHTSIPITIDSPAPNALEDTTRRLQECRGVAFVDVVFVHFEDESEQTADGFARKDRTSHERRHATDAHYAASAVHQGVRDGGGNGCCWRYQLLSSHPRG